MTENKVFNWSAEIPIIVSIGTEPKGKILKPFVVTFSLI